MSEITKIASNFLQLGSEEIDIGDAIGVTEEVARGREIKGIGAALWRRREIFFSGGCGFWSRDVGVF